MNFGLHRVNHYTVTFGEAYEGIFGTRMNNDIGMKGQK